MYCWPCRAAIFGRTGVHHCQIVAVRVVVKMSTSAVCALILKISEPDGHVQKCDTDLAALEFPNRFSAAGLEIG
jgi:hypothetical protein